MAKRTRTARADIGIIGGSGLYDIEGLHQVKRVTVPTPFGPPSSPVVLGELDGIRVAFLSRHGPGHRFNPSEINYRANVYALKAIGVRRVISVSAVGSMKESIKPGQVVLPDQFIDLTKRRIPPSLRAGWWPTWHLPIRSARRSARHCWEPAAQWGPPFIRAAPTSAWKVRNSPRRRSPICTANGA